MASCAISRMRVAWALSRLHICIFVQCTANAQSKTSHVAPRHVDTIHVCSEGTDISGTLQEVVLVEHQTRNPDAGFIAADQHWTDKVCCAQHYEQELTLYRGYF